MEASLASVRSDPLGSESSARVLLEKAPWPMALIDNGQRIKYANPAFCELLELELPHVAGRMLSDLLKNDQKCMAMLRRVLDTRQAESHVGDADSTSASKLWSYTIWPAMSGNSSQDVILQVMETIQGHQAIVAVNEALVLASLRQQELASESENRFYQIADAAPVLIWISDTTKQITWFNKTWLEFTGRSLQEELNDGWTENLHPHDRPDYQNGYHASFEARKGFVREFRLRFQDGGYRWLLGNGIPRFSPGGEFLGFIGCCIEITRQKQVEDALRASEERMRLATEATGVGIWEWNLLTNDLYWDAELFRMYGLPPTEGGHVLYSDWTSTVLPEDLDVQEAALHDTIKRRGHGTREFRIRRPDGSCRIIYAVEAVRTNAEGVPEWIVGTNFDITERRQSEISLREYAAALAQADRSKNEFLAMLAHELRNPLAPMRNSVAILQTPEASNEERQQAHFIINRQLGNMTRMIDDLLDVARITEGKIELRKQPISLQEVLTATISMVRSAATAENQKLEVSLPDSPIFVDGDSTRLEQVFTNLLGNACKYAGNGSHIWLTAELSPHAPGEPGEVTVKVRDDGVGIDPALLPRVFDLFVQATRSLDRSHGGLGIGLTLAGRLVQLHGGQIEARSEGVGHGAEFIVKLPTLPFTPAKPVSPPKAASASPKRILIVDDNKDSAHTLAVLQTRRGHLTRTAFNGFDALTEAAEFIPDVILLDIGLPGIDGLEVARRLRAMPELSKVLLVAMTGYATAHDREQSKQAGFDEHLVKPIDLELLRTWLNDLR